jgi:hypothetical protein
MACAISTQQPTQLLQYAARFGLQQQHCSLAAAAHWANNSSTIGCCSSNEGRMGIVVLLLVARLATTLCTSCISSKQRQVQTAAAAAAAPAWSLVATGTPGLHTTQHKQGNSSSCRSLQQQRPSRP